MDAAIGGTPSNLSAFRLQRDVLPHKLDLTFVEFAANDDPIDPIFEETMEGVIRQLKASDPNMEVIVILIGLADRDTLAWKYEDDVFSKVQNYHSSIAVYYGAPYIDIVAGGNALIRAGVSSIDSMFPRKGRRRDGIHPKEVGHKIYSQVILSALDSLKNVSGQPVPLREPKTPNRFEKAKIVELSKLPDLGQWQPAAKTKGQYGDQDSRKSFNTVIEPPMAGARIELGEHPCQVFGLYYEETPLTDTVLVHNSVGDTLSITNRRRRGVFGAPRARITFPGKLVNAKYTLEALTNDQVKAGYFLCAE